MTDKYKASPYYQNLGIEKLQEQMNEYSADETELYKQAEAQYKPVYDMELETLRQQTAQQIQGYGSQREGVSASYERARRQTNEAYDESAAALSNALNKRGLGRSSLVSTQGAYLESKRNQALADIGQDEQEEIAAINEKIALLTDQAAKSERTLAGNYARQLENRVNELKEKNKSASLSLQLQIAALQQQGYEAYQEWLRGEEELELKKRQQELKESEFEKKYPEKTTSAGSGSENGDGAKKQTGSVKQDSALSGQAAKVSGALTALLEGLREKLTPAKGSGTNGTGGTTARKATAAKRQTARE